VPAYAAPTDDPLRARIESGPRLPLYQTDLSIKLPRGVTLGMVSWAARDRRTGITWLIQRGDQAAPVLAVDGDGNVVHAFGKGLYKIPHSIRIDPDGNIWTVDAGSSRIIKFSPAGQELLDFYVGPPGSQENLFTGPTDIAFLRGRAFITDGYANARVLEYTMDGKKLREWGTAGTGPGQFHLPHSIVADENGTLYVADRENGRIEAFDPDGKFLREINHLGRVYALQIGHDGTLWASLSPADQDPGAAGWIVRLDRSSGTSTGYVRVTDTLGLHCLELADDSEPMTGIGSKLVLFRLSTGSHP
jgi:streptogramin lyase